MRRKHNRVIFSGALILLLFLILVRALPSFVRARKQASDDLLRSAEKSVDKEVGYPIKGASHDRYDKKGRRQGRFTAEGLQDDTKDGHLAGTNVTYEAIGTNGETRAVIRVDRATYDRGRGKVESDSDVRVERDGMVVTGKGLELDPEEERATIQRDVKVVLTPGPIGKTNATGGTASR